MKSKTQPLCQLCALHRQGYDIEHVLVQTEVSFRRLEVPERNRSA